MWGQGVFVVLLFSLSLFSVQFQFVLSNDNQEYSWVQNEDVHEAFEFFSKSRTLDRHRPNGYKFAAAPVNGFHYSNCGGNDPFHITSLTVSPDPIHIPGTLNFTFSVTSKVNITAPVQVKLKVEKKVGFWIEIPCVDGVGSCTYDDICSKLPSGPCPPLLQKHNIPCHCPISAGTYTTGSAGFSVKIPDTGLPGFLTDGDFKAQAEVYSGGQRLACYEVYASIG